MTLRRCLSFTALATLLAAQAVWAQQPNAQPLGGTSAQSKPQATPALRPGEVGVATFETPKLPDTQIKGCADAAAGYAKTRADNAAQAENDARRLGQALDALKQSPTDSNRALITDAIRNSISGGVDRSKREGDAARKYRGALAAMGEVFGAHAEVIKQRQARASGQAVTDKKTANEVRQKLVTALTKAKQAGLLDSAGALPRDLTSALNGLIDEYEGRVEIANLSGSQGAMWEGALRTAETAGAEIAIRLSESNELIASADRSHAKYLQLGDTFRDALGMAMVRDQTARMFENFAQIDQARRDPTSSADIAAAMNASLGGGSDIVVPYSTPSETNAARFREMLEKLMQDDAIAKAPRPASNPEAKQ